MEMIEELREERNNERINQEWLEKNSDDLEESLQELMSDQEFMLEDLATTKKMLQNQLDSQKSYLDMI